MPLNAKQIDAIAGVAAICGEVYEILLPGEGASPLRVYWHEPGDPDRGVHRLDVSLSFSEAGGIVADIRTGGDRDLSRRLVGYCSLQGIPWGHHQHRQSEFSGDRYFSALGQGE